MTSPLQDSAPPLKFEHFEIHPRLRQVWVRGHVAPLGGRAFDLLLLLARQRERVVSKDEIFEAVWPGLVVEDNNLSVQVSALRKALGADIILTVSGRGYQFTAPRSDSPVPESTEVLPGNLAVRSQVLYGRSDELAQLMASFEQAGCITICGLAGVGKTALAQVASRRLAAQRRFAHGAWCVDLTLVRDPTQLALAVSHTLGLEPGEATDASHCLAQLQHRELLLVLDNCEHVIDAAAEFVTALLARAEHVQVLTTSQEPLHLPGEQVLRLAPLAVPDSADCADVERYGAMRLLLERVRAAMGGRFEPDDADRMHLVEICRQLDGIPLALEFAASRIPLLGPAGVRSRLHDRLRLLSGGQRTAPPRHRSLQAALEWSHQLLSPRTRHVLHRLAVFPSGFSLEGASLLLQLDSDPELIEHLDVLVDRSIVTLQSEGRRRYRLLETTRAFALERLAQEGDGIDWEGRLAQAMSALCLLCARERDTTWLQQEMPNARVALAWSLAHAGFEEAAVTIATYTSVVLGSTGGIGEAIANLQQVGPLLNDGLPEDLRARYWHWLGRLGVEGRLPGAQCIEYLQRADAMFVAQGEPLHRHGCQRHLAEAQLLAGRPDLAEAHLQAARHLEGPQPRASDRVRRLRVEVLLAASQGEHRMALLHAQTGLMLAEAHGFEHYRMLLTADMAWSHLQVGHANAAVTSFQELLVHLQGQPLRFSLARARALTGLTAALLAAERVDEAARGVLRTAQALQQENLLQSRCDILAWAAAANGILPAAAQFLGASDGFAAASDTERDPVSTLAHARALALLGSRLDGADLQHWHQQGVHASEGELMHLITTHFGTAPLPRRHSLEASS